MPTGKRSSRARLILMEVSLAHKIKEIKFTGDFVQLEEEGHFLELDMPVDYEY